MCFCYAIQTTQILCEGSAKTHRATLMTHVRFRLSAMAIESLIELKILLLRMIFRDQKLVKKNILSLHKAPDTRTAKLQSLDCVAITIFAI